MIAGLEAFKKSDGDIKVSWGKQSKRGKTTTLDTDWMFLQTVTGLEEKGVTTLIISNKL